MKIALLIALLLRFGAAATLYPMSYTVTALEPDADTVVMERADGHEFAFYGIEDWTIGDRVAALMLDPGTPNDVTDDIIVSVH